MLRALVITCDQASEAAPSESDWYRWALLRDTADTTLNSLSYVHASALGALAPLFKLCNWAFTLQPLPSGVVERTQRLYMERPQTRRAWSRVSNVRAFIKL